MPRAILPYVHQRDPHSLMQFLTQECMEIGLIGQERLNILRLRSDGVLPGLPRLLRMPSSPSISNILPSGSINGLIYKLGRCTSPSGRI